MDRCNVAAFLDRSVDSLLDVWNLPLKRWDDVDHVETLPGASRSNVAASLDRLEPSGTS